MTEVHLIWVGGEPPQWAQQALATWREQCPVVFWDDAAVAADVRLAHLAEVGRGFGLTYRGIADLLRIEILRQCGGIYLDLDSVPLRVDRMFERPAPWVGVEPDRPEGLRVLINSVLAFPPGHPVLDIVMQMAFEQLRLGHRNEHYVAGPRVWAKVQNEVPLVPVIPTVTSGGLPRRFALGESLDLEELREQYPDAEALHIIYSRKHAR